ncbi:MAG: hypothetical protein EZS28_037169, partial [Streblomastix strix]
MTADFRAEITRQLEERGVIDRFKSQLKSAIYLTIKGKLNDDSTKNVFVQDFKKKSDFYYHVIAFVYDCLVSLHLNNTAAVFIPELEEKNLTPRNQLLERHFPKGVKQTYESGEKAHTPLLEYLMEDFLRPRDQQQSSQQQQQSSTSSGNQARSQNTSFSRIYADTTNQSVNNTGFLPDNSSIAELSADLTMNNAGIFSNNRDESILSPKLTQPPVSQTPPQNNNNNNNNNQGQVSGSTVQQSSSTSNSQSLSSTVSSSSSNTSSDNEIVMEYTLSPHSQQLAANANIANNNIQGTTSQSQLQNKVNAQAFDYTESVQLVNK